MTTDASFLNLTLKNQNTNQVQKTTGDLNSQQTGKSQQAGKTDQLKTTDIFTAEKQGMKAENKTQNALQGGNSGFSGINAFGDSDGYGDTVQFTTKTNNTDKVSIATNPIGNMSGANATNDNKELQEIAEKLGVKADENTVKNKLASMDSEQLTKLGGDTLDKANDLGLVSTGDIEKANKADDTTETKGQNPFSGENKNNTDKPSFGGFTGKNSGGFSIANNDKEIKEIAEGLGVEANENTIKNKLSSMNPQELVKLDGDTLNNAADLGYISMSDIDKKLGINQKNNNTGNENKEQDKKIKFGTLSGNEV